jgi:DNA (cytosine-5)-methyltransferase 1
VRESEQALKKGRAALQQTARKRKSILNICKFTDKCRKRVWISERKILGKGVMPGGVQHYHLLISGWVGESQYHDDKTNPHKHRFFKTKNIFLLFKNNIKCLNLIYNSVPLLKQYVEMSHNLNGFHPKAFAEFFAGIGLMRLGLEKAGWQISFANDIDPTKESIYRKHFKDSENHFHLGDIHQLKSSQIPNVSLATASFPCTDLSLAGRREGLSGSQSSAFWGFVNVLEEMGKRRPPIVLLENVEGFLTSHNGNDLKEALLALNELGYSIDAFIIDAVRFVPQSRVRLFVVGHQTTEKPERVSEKQLSFYQSDLRPAKLANFILRHPEINWNIRDLPSLPKTNSRLADIIEEIPETSKEWWNGERIEYLLNQTFDRHRVLIEAAKSGKDYTYFTAFRRVREGRSMAEIRSDGIAGCLRTPKGGSARQILLRVGKGKIDIRLLSPRECARLMGADEYHISGNINQALFGFGDAVCVPVVTWISENYLNPLLSEINNVTVKQDFIHEYQTAAIGI